MTHRRGLRITAYHEAGHAVAAWALGHGVLLVTIVPEGECSGKMTHGAPRPTYVGAPRYYEERAVIAMAGPAAQRFHAPRSAVRHHASYDVENLDSHTEAAFYKRDGAFPDEDRKRPFFRLIDHQARDLVAAHWLAVHRLADELLQHGSLGGFRVASVCLEATEEWRQVSLYLSGKTAFDYVRADLEAGKVRRPLRRADLAAATLRAVAAGAADIGGAVVTDLTAHGFPEADCRTLWSRITAPA